MLFSDVTSLDIVLHLHKHGTNGQLYISGGGLIWPNAGLTPMTHPTVIVAEGQQPFVHDHHEHTMKVISYLEPPTEGFRKVDLNAHTGVPRTGHSAR